MLPSYDRNSLKDYLNNLRDCVKNNDVSIERIDDAVMRILAVKMSMGLVQVVGEDKVEKPEYKMPECK